MTAPLFTVLLPHLRQPANDAALRIALDTLVTHTALDFELLLESVAERRDIYPVINHMARRAEAEWLVFWNSDTFASPNWAEPLWEARDANTIVSPVLVECGAIGVHEHNLKRDFGMTPRTYRRAEFEAWAAAGGDWLGGWVDGERAWYFPSLINRRRFLELGGFDSAYGAFPEEPVDIHFWDTWQAAGGKFKRVRSWIYHLQNYSSAAEQGKAVRRA